MKISKNLSLIALSGLLTIPAMADFKERSEFISAVGTNLNLEVMQDNMLPRGAAMITSSGRLANDGITSIIHVAPGAMGQKTAASAPSIEGVEEGIHNALILAQENEIKRVALPFIGSSIFRSSIGLSKDELATIILKTLDSSAPEIEKVMVVYKNKIELQMFKDLHDQLNISDKVIIVEGSITEFSDHQAESIMNAANMEVSFGGGVSGVIGRASGEANLIDDFAAREIRNFNEHFTDEIADLKNRIYVQEIRKANFDPNRESELKDELSRIERSSRVSVLEGQRDNLVSVHEDQFFLARWYDALLGDYTENLEAKEAEIAREKARLQRERSRTQGKIQKQIDLLKTIEANCDKELERTLTQREIR